MIKSIAVKTINETDSHVIFNAINGTICIPQAVLKSWPQLGEFGFAFIDEWYYDNRFKILKKGNK